MTTAPPALHHGIQDNHTRGNVADFLAVKISHNSKLSVVSAYFTIYAYDALSKQLDGIESLRFLFGEPRFVASLDPDKTDKKAFKIEDEGLESTSAQLVIFECVVQCILESISRPEYERLLNGLVYELFFPEDLHAKNIHLFDACAAAGIGQGMDATAVAQSIFHPSHTIYALLFELQTLDVVRVIEAE